MCVVGKKELVDQLVEKLKIMQTNIREVAEQFEKTEVDLTPEGLENMRNDCQGSINGAEKSPDSGNC